MPEITIKISIPEGTSINLGGLESVLSTVGSAGAESQDHVARYWNEYLSPNGRKVFGQAARRECHAGPGYTLEDLAAGLSIDYESIKSYHRSTGRAAKRWHRDTGLAEPIKLVSRSYEWDREHEGWRTEYQLPEGVAAKITDLEIAG